MTTSKAAEDAPDQRWIVHKFGGSSVADAECIARVAGIIEADPGTRVAVVLSACKGITDELLELVTLAEHRSPAASERLAAIKARQHELHCQLRALVNRRKTEIPKPNSWPPTPTRPSPVSR